MKELQAVNQQVLLDMTASQHEQQTASGIITPRHSRREIKKWRWSRGMSVIDAEIEVEYEGKKYLIIPYADILAKVVETEEI